VHLGVHESEALFVVAEHAGVGVLQGRRRTPARSAAGRHQGRAISTLLKVGADLMNPRPKSTSQTRSHRVDVHTVDTASDHVVHLHPAAWFGVGSISPVRNHGMPAGDAACGSNSNGHSQWQGHRPSFRAAPPRGPAASRRRPAHYQARCRGRAPQVQLVCSNCRWSCCRCPAVASRLRVCVIGSQRGIILSNDSKTEPSSSAPRWR
jgi:hypothetical protein